MKKIKIFSTIALSLALASCDNFELPNPPAQSNPDPGVEGVFENSGLRLSQSSADVNLIEASNKNENVAVARIDELVNFPEGYDLRVDMQVAGNDQFGKYATVKTTIADNLVYVNPTDFDSAIQEAITRNPAKLNVATRFVAYAERGTTLFRLGGMDEYYGRYEYSVKPLDPAKTLEQDYYLVGSFCNWDPRKAIKFNNTVEGANIYDNPVLAVREIFFGAAELERLLGGYFHLAAKDVQINMHKVCRGLHHWQRGVRLGPAGAVNVNELFGHVPELVAGGLPLDDVENRRILGQVVDNAGLFLCPGKANFVQRHHVAGHGCNSLHFGFHFPEGVFDAFQGGFRFDGHIARAATSHCVFRKHLGNGKQSLADGRGICRAGRAYCP